MRKITFQIAAILLPSLLLSAGGCHSMHDADSGRGLERITLSADGGHFVTADSQRVFVPWGFNYDHDSDGRLLEDYWLDEWPAVEEDFARMKALGATVVRIHLQLGKFMNSETAPDHAALAQLSKLTSLAERTGLYLDITGLACYHKQDVPAWYDALDEAARWKVQARFWRAVAQTCASSPAVFCYDLMNEPVVTGGDKLEKDWLAGKPFGNSYFVQRINLDAAGRTTHQIAEQWVTTLTRAIRKQDPGRLITVGVIPWAMTWPNARPVFYAPPVARHLDFVSIHVYPKQGEVGKALAALAVYDIGKPLVIEEMFNLNCDIESLDAFVTGSRSRAEGWIGFFWGRDIDDCQAFAASLAQRSQTPETFRASIGNAMLLQWLQYFAAKTPAILNQPMSTAD